MLGHGCRAQCCRCRLRPFAPASFRACSRCSWRRFLGCRRAEPALPNGSISRRRDHDRFERVRDRRPRSAQRHTRRADFARAGHAGDSPSRLELRLSPAPLESVPALNELPSTGVLAGGLWTTLALAAHAAQSARCPPSERRGEIGKIADEGLDSQLERLVAHLGPLTDADAPELPISPITTSRITPDAVPPALDSGPSAALGINRWIRRRARSGVRRWAQARTGRRTTPPPKPIASTSTGSVRSTPPASASVESAKTCSLPVSTSASMMIAGSAIETRTTGRNTVRPRGDGSRRRTGRRTRRWSSQTDEDGLVGAGSAHDRGAQVPRPDDGHELEQRRSVGEHIVGHEVKRHVAAAIAAEIGSAHVHVRQGTARLITAAVPWPAVPGRCRRCAVSPPMSPAEPMPAPAHSGSDAVHGNDPLGGAHFAAMAPLVA